MISCGDPVLRQVLTAPRLERLLEKQAGAELCQAQHSLSLDLDIN